MRGGTGEPRRLMAHNLLSLGTCSVGIKAGMRARGGKPTGAEDTAE